MEKEWMNRPSLVVGDGPGRGEARDPSVSPPAMTTYYPPIAQQHAVRS